MPEVVFGSLPDNQKINNYISAVEAGDIDRVMELTDNGRDIDLIDAIPIIQVGQNITQDLPPALFVAIRKGNIDMLEKLLLIHADPDVGGNKILFFPDVPYSYEKITPLFYAINQNDIPAVDLLLTQGANANHYAVTAPDFEEVGVEYNGIHPIAYAILLGGYEPDVMNEIVNLILDKGGPIEDLSSTMKFDPINASIDTLNFRLAEILLDKYEHANPNEVENDPAEELTLLERKTALMNAIDKVDHDSTQGLRLIEKLLVKGADPNNNMGLEYGINHVYDEEFFEQNRRNRNFRYSVHLLTQKIDAILEGIVRDPTYIQTHLTTALDYAFKENAPRNVIDLLRRYDGKTTIELLHDNDIIRGSGEININDDESRRKILEIPIMTEEEYNTCKEHMQTSEEENEEDKKIIDFLTFEPVERVNAIKLPSQSGNITCMDRDSFVEYANNKIQSHEPITHPFTREILTENSDFNDWMKVNFPFGLGRYNDIIKQARESQSQGGKSHKKRKTLKHKRKKKKPKTKKHARRKFNTKKKKNLRI